MFSFIKNKLFLIFFLLFNFTLTYQVTPDYDLTLHRNPNFLPGRTGIVHLFEWNFKSVAEECENFLSTHGYGGVQVSPVNEYLVMEGRPWFERYQPFSYKIISRSGNEDEFADMVTRCNNVGIRVYVDVVINHMSGNSSNPIGVGGSVADTYSKSYPDAGYTAEDFHATCQIDDWTSVEQMRNCELVGLHDLDQSKDNVRRRIIDFLNKLIDYGAAGIRVDAAKHVWPEDLKYIYSNLHDLNTKYFSNGTRPFIYQEVTDMGGEAISAKEYSGFGRVTDFTFGSNLGNIFHKKKTLSSLKNFATLLNDEESFVFVDNHDNQRGHGAGGDVILTYKLPKPYKMALGFTLAWPYGVVRVMSSYYFSDPSQGPPHNDDYSLKDVEYYWDGTCSNGWVCEHRWRQIYNMNKFRSIVAGTNVTNWWDDGGDQIAFSRGNKGFIALNNNDYKLFERLQTGMPPGYYCDIISGEKLDGSCTGKLIVVGNDGFAFVYIGANDFDGFIAIHEKSRLWNPSRSYFKKINKIVRFNKQMYFKKLSKKKRSVSE